MTSKQILFDKFCEQVLHHVTLNQTALASLISQAGTMRYARKTALLNAGDSWDKLFYIHHGLIRLFYTSLEGRDFNKAFFWEGHCIWPVAPRDRNEGCLFSIAAVEDTTVLTLPFRGVQAVLTEQNQWEPFALPFAERLVEQKFLREHDFLLLSATERFKQFFERYPHIVTRLPDYHLASYLGITNVSLSRIKRTLKL